MDFYCKELLLAIEVDGRYHNHEEIIENDIIRQQRLESLGVTLLRFSEAEVKDDIFKVIRTIETTVIKLVRDQN